MDRLISPEDAVMAKPDGTTRTIEVQFGSGSLITFETDTPIEVRDTFERKLPNGAVELWEITKSAYFRSMGGIAANYQCKTRQKEAESPKMTAESSAKASSDEVFIVHGHDEVLPVTPSHHDAVTLDERVVPAAA